MDGNRLKMKNLDNHIRNKSLYTMDGKKDRWRMVYYPIHEDGKTNIPYEEPRALMQNIDKAGFWSKEVPLRYLTEIAEKENKQI